MPKKASKKVVKKATKKVAVKKTAKKVVKTPTGKHVSRITKNDPAREHRIDYEIVVDAYDSYERTIGWYCSLEDTIENQLRQEVRERRRDDISQIIKTFC